MLNIDEYLKNQQDIKESININKRDYIDKEWLDSEKPVKTADGRTAVITKIDMSVVPNIIYGEVKMKDKLFKYEWLDSGICQKALDNRGNPKKPDQADYLIKQYA